MEKNALKGERNYQIDVIKFVLSMFIFMHHTKLFSPQSAGLRMPYCLGWISVHCFFVISGFLMVNSIDKRNYNGEYAECNALEFVMVKFKGFFLYMMNAEIFIIVIRIILNRKKGFAYNMYMIVQTIPEIIGVKEAVGRIGFNFTWYISAMLLAMLPLSYIMIRNKKFYLNIFAPLVSLFTFGYIFSTGGMAKTAEWYGICNSTIVRAVCGLCFGANAWLLCRFIQSFYDNKKTRTALTIAEILFSFIFLFTFFYSEPEADDKTLFSSMLLIPFITAIIFSGKSYVSRMFTSDKLKYMGVWSLLIYLDQMPARMIVKFFLPEKSYWCSVAYVMVFTVLFCILNHLMTKFEKYIKKCFVRSSEYSLFYEK